jgi:hypothetical protein
MQYRDTPSESISPCYIVVSGHVPKVNLLGSVDVGSIGENADGHARTGDIGESIYDVRAQ